MTSVLKTGGSSACAFLCVGVAAAEEKFFSWWRHEKRELIQREILCIVCKRER